MVKNWKDGGWGVLVRRVDRIGASASSQREVALNFIPQGTKLYDDLHQFLAILKNMDSQYETLSLLALTSLRDSIDSLGKATFLMFDKKKLELVYTNLTTLKAAIRPYLTDIIEKLEEFLKYTDGENPIPENLAQIIQKLLSTTQNIPQLQNFQGILTPPPPQNIQQIHPQSLGLPALNAPSEVMQTYTTTSYPPVVSQIGQQPYQTTSSVPIGGMPQQMYTTTSYQNPVAQIQPQQIAQQHQLELDDQRHAYELDLLRQTQEAALKQQRQLSELKTKQALEEARAAQAVKEKAQKEAVEVARKLATVESERKAAADKARVDAVRAETMANVENNRQKRESKRFKAPVDTTTQIKAETATEPSKTKALQTIQEAKAIISTLQKKKVSDMSDEERATRKKEGERIAQAANDLKETERKAKAAAKAAKERNDKEAREQKLLEKQQKNEEIVRKDKEAKAAAALNAKAVEGSAQKTPRPTSAKKRK